MSTNQPRRPGTKTVRPSKDIAPGETAQIPLSALTGGPRNQEGYLTKYMPFDGVVFDSYHGERVEGSITGSEYDPIPSNSARTFDSVKVNSVYVRVPSGNSNTLQKEDLELILFTTEESARGDGARFSISGAIEDLVPGLDFGVRTDR